MTSEHTLKFNSMEDFTQAREAIARYTSMTSFIKKLDREYAMASQQAPEAKFTALSARKALRCLLETSHEGQHSGLTLPPLQ